MALKGIISEADSNPYASRPPSLSVSSTGSSNLFTPPIYNPVGGSSSSNSSINGDGTLNNTRQRTLHENAGNHFPVNDYQFPEIIQNKGKTVLPTPRPAKTPGEEQDIDAEIQKKKQMDLEKEEIQRFLLDKNAEVIVVLEGVDPMTSHNVQSYHSYVSEEIKWDHFFVRCCSVVNGKWTRTKVVA